MSQKNNTSLSELLAADPARLRELVTETADWRLDAGLVPISRSAWNAETGDWPGAVERLFAGEIVNRSEQRPALHPWLRAPIEGVPDAFRTTRQRFLDLADDLHAGRTPVRTLLHIGIGGSSLGPHLVVDALDAGDSAVELHWLSTLDGRRLDRLLGTLDPASTGLVIASKSFGTRETRLQAEAVRAWMGEGWSTRTWAATARPDRAQEWGLDASAVLPFDASIGGRFSLWSSVGVSAAARLGRTRFEALLEGAARADVALREAPFTSLAGRLARVIDHLVRSEGFDTLGVVSYAPGLRRLADYLQQLVMESLGKRATADGQPFAGPSAPLIFGGGGTDLQHALFQAVHQGTRRHPMLLIGEVPSDDRHGFQAEQIANLMGQARTLALGRSDADPQRALPGGNPVLTLLTRELNPGAVGELLAHWEHAVFLLGCEWNLNPFDQWGVEEGKRQAAAYLTTLAGQGEGAELDDLVAWARRNGPNGSR